MNNLHDLKLHLEYDPELPICLRKDEIAEAIQKNQVVVICGETGSGKSTQIPKICLELGYGRKKKIGHTQPRRIAARSVATRIAEELHTPLGQGVGYKIRFTDQTGPMTRIKLMTDGILLAESQTDPLFHQYDVIIIDEAHERSLNIDFLLGILKRVLHKRRDLKLIITSATIDANKFAEHFSTYTTRVPVIEVSGRAWPIDILYRPVDPRERSEMETEGASHHAETDEDAWERTFFAAVDELAQYGRGDMLVFMPTEHDIFETAKLLKHHHIPGDDAARKTEILPLYARLPSSEQQKIFHPTGQRRIVIATNVAESSLTVPGIKYIIDSGTARISRYSARSKTQRLPIEPISQASADQRAGRCGRIGPGVCIRLYSEQDYLARDKYTTPEIRRTNLASVILQTKAFRLGPIERFPFIDPPVSSAINDGYKTLFEIGALDAEKELTPLGKRLARLPVDPRIARMILAADSEKCLREILIIASALELQDPRERPHDLQEKADEKHAQFIDEQSDFLSWLKIWDFWQGLKDKLSQSQLRKAARENFLSWNRMNEWTDLHLQLRQLAKDANLLFHDRSNNYDAIHRAILTGLLYGISKQTETQEYQTTGNTKFYLWPGSGLKKKKYPWIMAGERLETSKKFLRTLAKINPDWIESIAAHLLERTWFEPHWSPKSGLVNAWERISVYGLVIIPKRRVNYGPIDPEKAREVFLWGALVEGDFPNAPTFFTKNQERRAEIERMQTKLRTQILLRGPEAIYDFYNERIPKDVFDRPSLERWYRKLPSEQRDLLLFKQSDLCFEDLPEGLTHSYPDNFHTLQGTTLPLDYEFKPGENDDGVSVSTPIESLNQLDTSSLGWLVQGLLEQKIVALLKTLPKDIRRELIPVAETARLIKDSITFGEGDLLEVLARQVSRLVGRLVTGKDFDSSRLPNDLIMNVKVLGAEGNLIDQDRDLDALRKRLGIEITRSFSAVTDPKWTRDGLTSWDFGSLPEYVTLSNGNIQLKGYPALCDPRFLQEENKKFKDKTLSLRLFDSPLKAVQYHRTGILRLFSLNAHDELLNQTKWIPNLNRYGMLLTSIPHLNIVTFCMELLAASAVDLLDRPLPRNEGELNHLVRDAREKIAMAVQEITRWIRLFATNWQGARLAMEQNKKGLAANAVTDVDFQISQLLIPGFHWNIPWQRLREYPRYLEAISVRFEKIKSSGPASDCNFTDELRKLWIQYEDVREKQSLAGIIDPELDLYRWMLEEYRVSLFAQKLGTCMKISAVRLEKQWDKVIR